MLMGRNARTGPVDLFVLGLITVVAGFVRIHRIDSPRTPIFDESYAGYITNRYRHGNEYFFDLHPPFGRLVQYYVGVVALGAPECMYTKDMQFVECDMWQMRIVPCVCGTLLVPLSYAIARLHGASPVGGVCAAFFIAADNMLLTLSRIHLLDIVTVFSIALTVFCHARFLRCADCVIFSSVFAPRHLDKHKRQLSVCPRLSLSALIQGLVWLILDGACLGCAVSSKFGVAAPTAIWCVLCNGLACWQWSCHRHLQKPAPENGRALRVLSSYVVLFVFLTSILAAVALLEYFVLLAWHFSLIPWKNVETGSYASYLFTKKRVSAEAMTPLDLIFEAFLLRYVDYDGNRHGIYDKVVDFTIDQ